MSILLTLTELQCGWDQAEVYEPGRKFVFAENHGLLPIMGRTGYGKTTLLNVLSGYMAPIKGRVHWQIGKEEFTWSRDEPLSPALRRRLPFGFARQGADLPPVLTIGETLNGLLRFRGFSRREAARMAGEAISSFLIAPETVERMWAAYPHQLSGGQQHRMALACAIAHRPAVLFADEPTGSVDEDTRDEVLGVIRDWLYPSEPSGPRAMVYVTHLYEVNHFFVGHGQSRGNSMIDAMEERTLSVCFVALPKTQNESGGWRDVTANGVPLRELMLFHSVSEV